MFIFLLVLVHVSRAAAVVCQSPQYIEVGKSGTIVCAFSEDFDSINWYDSDSSDRPPTLSYDGQTKEGTGFTSGEFDITPDGSLIINNVSVEHDSKFLVYETKRNQPIPNSYEIMVIIFIRPKKAFPLVDDCVGHGGACYRQWRRETPIVCRLEHARPAIPLRLLASTTNGNINITDNTSFTRDGDTWTSSISTTDPHLRSSSYLALVICEAVDQLHLLDRSQTITLVHDAYKDTSALSTARVAVERNKKITLKCSDSDFEMFVWERISSERDGINMITFNSGSNHDDFIASHQYESESGNLIISKAQIQHEGLYRCTYSDGTSDSVTLRDLTVVVNPVPKILTIEGCPTDAYCLIEANSEGTLSCSVKGIYPDVGLEWKAYRGESSDVISFHSRDVETRLVGETYDITLTTKYIAQKTADRRTVECKVVGPNAELFNLTIKADLIFSASVDRATTNKYPTASDISEPGFNIVPVIITVVVVVVIIALLSVLLLLSRARRRRRLNSTLHASSDEKIPMMHNMNSDKDGLFLSQLKSNYENLYCAVNPIPFLPANYTVQELFVEGGVEYMSKNKKDPWQTLDSYRNIFNNAMLQSNRWIIEGEPGYGKSTLCLQLAYEWCNKVSGSYMHDVDIFLLIRLRQLKGVSSIYESIKRFLLPKDSKFTTEDIKKFIDNSPSVLIILDGFDEHPNKDSLTGDSDIINILKRTMLPDCKVVLTTRSSQLPKDFAAQTNRIKLTGFKTNAQEQYLQKAVLVNGNSSTDHTIKEWLEANPVLSDLCEIPLFFVMYAHLSLESNDLRQCTSVTSFFRYMITCLHHHLRLKSKDDNVDAIVLNENFHKDLDDLCFENLNGHSYNPDIPKDNLISRLGAEIVDQYLSIGIFREEKAIVVSPYPGVQASDHVKTITFIRFYHSLFCEWFAAHHLAECLDELHLAREQGRQTDNSTILEDLNPEELQYVYRFACGLKQTAAKLLLDHLQLVHGVDTFSMLCILEQAGNVDKILNHVKEICLADVGLQIRGFDTKILQRSVIQLMEIALSKQILIPKLTFLKSFKTVDTSKNQVVLISDARLKPLNGIKHLLLEQNENDFTEDSLDDFFKYASRCKDLELLTFVYSSVPYRVKSESGLKMIKAKNIKVDWFPSEIRYSLNVESGYWQQSTEGPHMTKEEYNKVSTSLRMMSKP